jgi:hypothetical protein
MVRGARQRGYGPNTGTPAGPQSAERAAPVEGYPHGSVQMSP